jgi:hypothetical protein
MQTFSEESKAFATKYAGKYAKLQYLNKEFRIVGYDGIFVVIERDDSVGWTAYNYAFTQVVYLNAGKTYYYVIPADLTLVEKIKPIKLYPNICKTCKLPARIINKLVFCSNTRCKSRKKINKLYKPTSIIFGDTRESPIIVRCLKCKGDVYSIAANKMGFGHAAECKKCSWQNYVFIENKWYSYALHTYQYVGYENGWWKSK